MRRTAAEKIVDVSRISARKRFGRYKEEGKNSIREAQVKKDKVMEQMERAWEAYGPTWKRIAGEECLDWEFETAVKAIREHVPHYTAKDVEKFTIVGGFKQIVPRQSKTEMFLSALIETCPEKNLTIHTGHIERQLGRTIDVGIRNTKNVIVIGNVDTVGHEMVGGSIHVEGTVFAVSCHIRNGTITGIRGATEKAFRQVIREGVQIEGGGRWYPVKFWKYW